MAIFLAVRAGIRDGKEGRTPFLWSIGTDVPGRKALLRDAWKDVAKLFVLAIILDIAFQLTVFGRMHPMETLFVAALLAFVPYALVRGPVCRLTRTRPAAKSRR